MPRLLPPFRTHLALLEHDLSHGERAPRIGARLHWIRQWLAQAHRQWRRADWIVAGGNPVLGALACAGACRAGQRAVWLKPADEDLWDYPLAMAGSNDDLLRAAGLPPMGQALFDALAADCQGRLTLARGWRLDYAFRGGPEPGVALAFASPGPDPAPHGPARAAAEAMAARAFEGFPGMDPLPMRARIGAGARRQVVEHARLALVGDALDGAARSQASDRAPGTGPGAQGGPQAGGAAGGAAPVRLGRARWHSQAPLEFASRSREDIRLALSMGGWA